MISLYQFSDIEISKEYLINQVSKKLYRCEPFEVDYRTIALLDISTHNIRHGKTLVVHEKLGVFFDMRTTREIMNEFYKLNGVGFAVSKAIFGFFNFRHYLPFVFAYVSYMPMTGGSRQSSDWVGLHLIKNFRQKGRIAYFTTVHGYKFSLCFPQGDLEQRVHDVCIISEKSVIFFKNILRSGLIELNPPNITGVVRQHEKCKCKNHQKMFNKILNINQSIDEMFQFVLNHLGIDKLEAKELIKFYRQNWNKFKKLY